jgi:hypothetical protein
MLPRSISGPGDLWRSHFSASTHTAAPGCQYNRSRRIETAMKLPTSVIADGYTRVQSGLE